MTLHSTYVPTAPNAYPVASATPAFVILSADRPDRSPVEQGRARADVEALLTLTGTKWKRVSGMFEGLREVSYVVVPTPVGSSYVTTGAMSGRELHASTDRVDYTWQLAHYYSQDSILFVDTDRVAHSIPVHGFDSFADAWHARTTLGQWRSAGTVEPREERGYTLDPLTGVYYVIRGQGADVFAPDIAAEETVIPVAA